jgi:hypothetical protein
VGTFIICEVGAVDLERATICLETDGVNIRQGVETYYRPLRCRPNYIELVCVGQRECVTSNIENILVKSMVGNIRRELERDIRRCRLMAVGYCAYYNNSTGPDLERNG